ncbi:MAG: methyltransferase [Gammaproteobacteria bacterium]
MRTLMPAVEALYLRDFLRTENYTERGLIDAIKTYSPPTPQMRNLARLDYLTREPKRLHVLIRLFFGGLAASTEEARVLPAEFTELCLRHGLLERDGDRLLPKILIEPHRDLLIASDTYAKLASSESYDYVLALNPTASYLLHFTIRNPVKAALDIGAGNGIQALVAATHCESVVATDLNPRAVMFTEFNARLNGIPRIEGLTGDLLQPVAGRRFDLIVSNPPFVLAPSKRYLYRDNELELDFLCRKLARDIPAHLNEGGFFQMICDSVQLAGQSWQARVGEWFAGNGCDVIVYKQYSQQPLAYAQTRLRETLHATPESDATVFRDWMDYYHAKGVEAIVGSLIVMRRRTGANWIAFQELASDLDAPFGDAVLQHFTNLDFLNAAAVEERLLAAKPRLAPHLCLDIQQQWEDRAWRTASLQLRIVKGLQQSLTIDGHIAGFIEKLDGERSLGELIEQLGAQTGMPVAEIKPQVLGTMRRLIERGFLLLP